MTRSGRSHPARLSLAALLAATAFATSACAVLAHLEQELDPGTGTPGLSGLPSDRPDDTRAYLGTLVFVPVPRISSIDCHGGVRADIAIYPEARAHNVDPEAAAKRGRIVARVVNTSGVACAELRLAAGATAYWWMGAYDGVPLRSVFWRIPATGAVTPLARTGPVRIFGDGQRPRPDARISARLVHPVAPDGDGGALAFTHLATWVTCLGGCCEGPALEAVTSPTPDSGP